MWTEAPDAHADARDVAALQSTAPRTAVATRTMADDGNSVARRLRVLASGRAVASASPAGATRRLACRSSPSSPAKHNAESKRGMHNQSTDPLGPTRAAERRSPINQ
jgi:hypothetical protein